MAAVTGRPRREDRQYQCIHLADNYAADNDPRFQTDHPAESSGIQTRQVTVCPAVVLGLDGSGTDASWPTSFAGATPDTPFFMLSYVSIRGIPAGQRMNQSVIQLESELRWMFRRKYGGVDFAGIGTAASGFDQLGDGRNVFTFGGGIRYRISEVDRLNVGLDIAYASNDGMAVCFRAGEAF